MNKLTFERTNLTWTWTHTLSLRNHNPRNSQISRELIGILSFVNKILKNPCCHGLVHFEWWFIYITQRVFGGNADGNTVSNADGCTMDGNKITPISLHDTANPIKPVKVNFASTSKHCTTATPPSPPPPLIDNRRASWWIGWNTMWKTVGTTLKMPKKNCIKPACICRKRERSGQPKITLLLSPNYRIGLLKQLTQSTVYKT